MVAGNHQNVCGVILIEQKETKLVRRPWNEASDNIQIMGLAKCVYTNHKVPHQCLQHYDGLCEVMCLSRSACLFAYFSLFVSHTDILVQCEYELMLGGSHYDNWRG